MVEQRAPLSHAESPSSRRVGATALSVLWTVRGLAVGALVGWEWNMKGLRTAAAVDLTTALILVSAVVVASTYVASRRGEDRAWQWANHGFTAAAVLAWVAFLGNVLPILTSV